MVCAMWALDPSSMEKVLYGDNAAAIGASHGTTASSWRTRHLRIRAAVLREAIDPACAMPEGPWKLLHLKGVELVADGATKPLFGQSFDRFLQDLEVDLPETRVNQQGNRRNSQQSGGGINGAARAVLLTMIACAVVARSEAHDDRSEAGWNVNEWVFLGGILLMGMGVIQLCSWLRVLWVYIAIGNDGAMELTTDDEDGVVVSEDEGELGSSATSVAPPSTSLPARSPSGSADVGGATTSRSMSRPSGSAARSSSTSKPISTRSGSATRSSSTSKSISTRSGVQQETTTSLTMTGPSGGSADAITSSQSMMPQSGSQQVVTQRPQNPWNHFQQQNRGQGWSSERMRAEYYKSKRP